MQSNISIFLSIKLDYNDKNRIKSHDSDFHSVDPQES